jgi:hypothetical protein
MKDLENFESTAVISGRRKLRVMSGGGTSVACKPLGCGDMCKKDNKSAAVAGICAGLNIKTSYCCGDVCGDKYPKKNVPWLIS